MQSSADVSALFAAQQSQFAQQNAYAQQLGMMTPAAGSFFRPPPPSFPGMVAPPPSYSYAPSQMQSYGFGNRIAGNAMSGLGAAAGFGGTALSAASMFGRMSAIAPLVDPFAGAAAGFGAAGIGGAMAGAALPLALGYGASRGIGSFIRGGQQQGAVNETLGQNFGFVNPGSRTGQGFDRTSMEGVSQVIRQIANVPEMMTSMEELTKMIPKLKSMGSMQGVHDLKEFSRRFKEQVSTISTMSKMLGTSMEEATDMFAHAKAVGARTPGQMMQNALSVQFTAAQTGMSNQQVMGMQQAGANMATGMGIRRSVGTTAVTNISQMLQKGVDRGRIAQADLEDLTGQQGPEAMSAAAQMMAGRLSQVAQGTSAGRLMMFGAAKFDAQGRFAGIDENVAKGLQSGAIGRDELMRRASKLTDQQKMAASGHIQSMSMELAGKLGPGGYGQFLKGVVGARFGENSTQLLMTKLGFGEMEADITEKMAGQVGTGNEDEAIFGKMKQRESQIKQQTDPAAIWQRLKTKLHRQTFGRLEEAGGRFHEYVAKAVDNFVDDLTGRAVVSISEAGAKRLEGAFTSGGQSALNDMLKSSGGRAAQGGNLAAALRSTTGPSLGQAAGGAIGGALGLVTGGSMAIGALGSSIGGALGGRGGYARSLRDTEAYASLIGGGGDTQTGRTSKGQFLHTAEGLGIDLEKLSGLSDAAAQQMVNDRQAQFSGMGKGLEGIARGMQMDVRGTMEGSSFDNATNAKKFDLLQAEVRRRREGIANRELAGGSLSAEDQAFKEKIAGIKEAAKKSGANVDYAITQALAGTGKAGVDSSMMGDLGAMVSDEKVKNMAKWQKDAEGGLEDVLGAEGASFLKSKPELSRTLSAMQSDPDLHDTIMNGTPAEALAALRKARVPGDASDIAALKSMASKMHQAMKSDPKSMDKINDYVNMNNIKDVAGFTDAAGKASKGVTDEALSGALANLAGANLAKTGDVQSKSLAVGKALQGAQARLAKAKSPEERQKILESLGDFAGGIENATSFAEGLAKKGSVSQDELAKSLGMSKEELAASLKTGDIGAQGKISVTAGVKEEIGALAAGRSVSGSILQAGKSKMQGDSSNELVDTLKLINKTIADNTTTIQGLKDGTMGAKVSNALSDGVSVVGKALDKVKNVFN